MINASIAFGNFVLFLSRPVNSRVKGFNSLEHGDSVISFKSTKNSNSSNELLRRQTVFFVVCYSLWKPDE